MGSHKILPQGRALRSPKTEVVKWLEETFYYAEYNSYPRPPHIRPQTFSMGFSKQPPNHSIYIACYNTHFGKPSSIKTRPKIGLKWCASCAIARPLRVSRFKGFKSLGCFGISKMLWDLKNALDKIVDIVDTVHLKRFVNQFVNNPVQNH